MRKGKYEVDDLFSSENSGTYHYYKGWNWRAYAAYVIGIIPLFPGFLSTVGVRGIAIGYQRYYFFALPIGILLGMGSYWAINVISPPPGGLVKEWSEPHGDIIQGLGRSEESVTKDHIEISEKV